MKKLLYQGLVHSAILASRSRILARRRDPRGLQPAVQSVPILALGVIFSHGTYVMDLPTLTRNKDVSLQRVGQEAILHDRRNGRAHVINESAAQIWELCDGQSSFDQIVSAFAAAYGLPAADVRADVQYILAKFHELRVLE
jgi:hypothetical protein